MTHIETAATSFASSFKNYLDAEGQERLKEAFTKGVEWAVADPDSLREILKPFAEWVAENQYSKIFNEDRWYGIGDIEEYTLAELISKYFDHINSKQDGLPKTKV